MSTATAVKHLLVAAKAPDSRGTFSGIIDANPPNGDSDNERVASWKNIPGEFPLGYQHAYGDPGSKIGTVTVRPKGDDRHLLVDGRLDLGSVMGRAIHERMLLPSDDRMALKELSVGFHFDRRSVTYDSKGVGVIEDALLLEVSVVYRGAQSTAITNVKDSDGKESTEARTLRNHLDSSHAQGVRAFKPPYADLVVKHRLVHVNTASVSERHLRTGVPDGDTVPVTSVMGSATRQRAAAKNRLDVQRATLLAEARLQRARAEAQRAAYVEQSNATNAAKMQADALMSMTLQEHYDAEAERDAWEIEKEQQIRQQKYAQREAEAAQIAGQPQEVLDWQREQKRRDAEAVADLLNQDGPSFTMQVDPANGQLRDPEDTRA